MIFLRNVTLRTLRKMSLTGMPRWLFVVTVALSLAALLLIANLPDSVSDSDNFKLNLEMPSVYSWSTT